MPGDRAVVRIGVFYDGNFFSHVSNYYCYAHERRARINIRGLHEFIRHQVAECEGCDVRYCQIVDAHYFRGRTRAVEAVQKGLLLKERLFDDVLVREGIVTHYLPMGPQGEKGIDVWLALEAFDLAVHQKFDVIVLIACDGDFLPLIRKLNSLGVRVMLLGWDFNWTDDNGVERETITAQVLLDEATYPISMHQLIDDRSRRNDPLINGMFLPHREPRYSGHEGESRLESSPAEALSGNEGVQREGEVQEGTIQTIKQGYGFIQTASGSTVFFHYTGVIDPDFNELKPGDRVLYEMGRNDRGPCAVRVRLDRREEAASGPAAES